MRAAPVSALRMSAPAILLPVLISALLSCAPGRGPARETVLSWPGMGVVEFGVLLENRFGIDAGKFCATNRAYSPVSDPADTARYYEGPELPTSLAPKIHPLLAGVSVSYEHGLVREVRFRFVRDLPTGRAAEILGLSGLGNVTPRNIQSVSFGENVYGPGKPAAAGTTRDVILTAFEHLGTGDSD